MRHGDYIKLLAGAHAFLIVMHLADLVVTPGCILPLLVCNSRAHWVLEQALSAAAPYTGLIAVVSSSSPAHVGAPAAL